MIHFKETGHWIDPTYQYLRVFAEPDESHYVNSQQSFYAVVLRLESLGKSWDAVVVDLRRNLLYTESTEGDD